MDPHRLLKRICVFLPAAFATTLSLAQQEVPAKEKVQTPQQKVSGPSPAELAKRQHEIEEIEAARRRQQHIGTVNKTVDPAGVPLPGNTAAKVKPHPAPDPIIKPKTELDPDAPKLKANPPK